MLATSSVRSIHPRGARQIVLGLALALGACGHRPVTASSPAPNRSPAAPAAPAPADCASFLAGGVACSLTYDDSLSSQLTVAAPALEAHHLTGTFFLQDVGADEAPWAALHARGHEVGSHTVHHPCPRFNTWVKRGFASEDYDLDRMAQELDDSLAFLGRLGQKPPFSFAYPCGVTTVGEDHRSYASLVDARFAAARGVMDHLADPHVDLAHTPGWFIADAAADLTAPLEEAAQNAAPNDFRWVVLGFHGVGGDYLSVSAEAHEALLAHLDSHRARIWTAPFGTVAACVKSGRQPAGAKTTALLAPSPLMPAPMTTF